MFEAIPAISRRSLGTLNLVYLESVLCLPLPLGSSVCHSMLRLCTALPLEEAYSYAMGHSPVHCVCGTDDGPLNAGFVLLVGYTCARGKYTSLPARLSILLSYARLTSSFPLISVFSPSKPRQRADGCLRRLKSGDVRSRWKTGENA